MGKTFVCGDIHGACRALIQCMERSEFDQNSDRLICLGDIFDGWPEMPEVLDLLMSLKDLVYIRGNHEEFALDWAETGKISSAWLANGGRTTVQCFPDGIPEKYLGLVKNSIPYFEENNNLFVHGGIIPGIKPSESEKDILLWDRSLFRHVIQAYYNHDERKFFNYDHVYIGHTPLHQFHIFKPLCSNGVWLMDTGAGWDGCLSMLNIETEEIFISDRTNELYQGIRGRG